jgi:glutamate racemase
MVYNNPIGIFDSGVGGLSVFKELLIKLPDENVVYFADSKNCPYGIKTKEEIIEFSVQAVDFLIKKNCKAIIIACNTATAAAIDLLRKKYTIPFIGMEPAVKPAALNSKTRSIAVLATEGTFNGRLFKETSGKYANDIELNVKVGNELVGIVENDMINDRKSILYIESLIQPLIEKNIDQLVLGCTHYPFLTPILQKILPKNINIVDPAPAVIVQTRRVLIENSMENKKGNKARYKFYSSGDISIIERIVHEITGEKCKISKF